MLRAHCAAVGRNPDEIEKTRITDYAIIGENKGEVKKRIKRIKPKGTSTEEFTKRNFVGTPDQFISQIQGFVDVGVTYFMLRFPDMIELKPLRMFAEQVLPAFK